MRHGASLIKYNSCSYKVENTIKMADYERIRLVVLGGAGVGKSAIIRRLLGQGFTERYRATVEDLYSRECILGTLTLKVDLLDTAGSHFIMFTSTESF